MSIQDLEQLAVKMSASSVSIGDWEKLSHFASGAGFVVELGTNIGSTSILLSALAEEVVTVDVFENIDLIEDPESREKYRNHFFSNHHYYDAIAGKLCSYPNITVLQSLSFEAAKKFPDRSVDLVFVDADHSYSGVKRDYEAWFDKVVPGGYFAFHDVGEGCPGVWKFYNEELLHDSRIEHVQYSAVGPCWTEVFRKRGEI
jgi:SAM-dependent methyltransferase